jgi:hypothetical protein
MLTTVETSELSGLLSQLDMEQKGIEHLLEDLRQQPPADELKMHRLKRRRLFIKEEMDKIKSIILPDIIA